jgi:predicted TIM-barrel fold metal-dependent hydrolase
MTSTDQVSTFERITDYLVFDVDQHFFEPATMWKEYLPARFRQYAPHTVIDSMGLHRDVIGDRTVSLYPRIPLPRLHPQLSGDFTPMSVQGDIENDKIRAGWDPKARLDIMDAEGVSAAIIYPTVAGDLGVVDDLEILVALSQAYNNWAADYCKASPKRLMAPAVVPQVDVNQTLIETKRAITELGATGIVMKPYAIGRTLEDPAWDPLWALLNDLEAPLAYHTTSHTPEAAVMVAPAFGSDRTDNYIFQHMMTHPFEMMAAMLTMIGGGILDRYPKLRVFFVESGCGWVPYWLERMEHHFATPYVGMQLSMRPTEFFQRQCFVAAESEEGAVIPALVSCVGADNICWSTDFPHPDHQWGGIPTKFALRRDISEPAKRKIIGENAARAYRWQPS